MQTYGVEIQLRGRLTGRARFLMAREIHRAKVNCEARNAHIVTGDEVDGGVKTIEAIYAAAIAEAEARESREAGPSASRVCFGRMMDYVRAAWRELCQGNANGCMRNLADAYRFSENGSRDCRELWQMLNVDARSVAMDRGFDWFLPNR